MIERACIKYQIKLSGSFYDMHSNVAASVTLTRISKYKTKCYNLH